MDQRHGGRPAARSAVTGAAPNGSALSLGLVHPGTLPMTVYRALAGALAPEIAVEVLQLHRLPDYRAAMSGDRDDITVEGLARSLAAGLPAHWQAGGRRRLLAGWSFGGLVALALADQMAGAEPPAHVVLLDTVASWTDAALSERAVRPHQVLAWFCMLLGARVGLAMPVDPARLRGTLDDVLPYIRDLAVERRVLAPGTTVPWLGDLFVGFAQGIGRGGRIAEGYRPRRLPTRLTVVKPEGSLFPGGSSLGWLSVAGRALRVVPCPGDHYSLLTDPAAVAGLAAILRSGNDVNPIALTSDRPGNQL